MTATESTENGSAAAAIFDRVQSHVFAPVKGHRYSLHVFINHEDPERVRELLARLLEKRFICSATEARNPEAREADSKEPKVRVVAAFTNKALCKLKVAYTPLPILKNKDRLHSDGAEKEPLDRNEEDAFEVGMRKRRKLGDPITHRDQYESLVKDGAGAGVTEPDHWNGYDKGVLLWISAESKKHAEDFVKAHLTRHIEDDHRHDEPGYWYPVNALDPDDPERKNQLLLGYVDGQSNPYVSEFRTHDKALAGGGTPTPDGWRPVPLGEFVLGHLDAGGATEAPGPMWFTHEGTFLVYRKYLIYGDRFDRLLKEGVAASEKFTGVKTSKENIAAKLMGRYQETAIPPGGCDAVVSSSNGTDNPTWDEERHQDRNDFRYDVDTSGYLCPLGAHARRANPRDALGFDGRLVERHRIIRRGSFRTLEDPKEGEPTQELNFVAVNARIADGFEFIQRLWLNEGTRFRVGKDPDIFAGSREDKQRVSFTIQGEQPAIVTSDEELSQLVGGDYFFVPALAALSSLIDGSKHSEPPE